jgi:anti-sigma B factor antagonist
MAKQTRRNLEVAEIGDVTVVSFLHRKLLDEQIIKRIGEQLFALVERDNRRKIVLDFSNVEYISSTMMGKMRELHILLQSRGGNLALCKIDSQIYEVFEITRLYKFFRIYKTLEEAVAILGNSLSDQFLITCPVQGCPGQSCLARAMAVKLAWLRCPECEARFSFRPPDIPQGGESMAEVFTVHLQTYTRDPEEGKDEYMELRGGVPFTLRIVGRLDLFTSAVFEKLWRSVPSPRRLIIDCSEVWDISERGAEVLTRLVTADGEGRVVVVMKEGFGSKPPKKSSWRRWAATYLHQIPISLGLLPKPMKEDKLPPPNTFPTDIPIVTDWDKALTTLGELPKDAGYPFTVKVIRP